MAACDWISGTNPQDWFLVTNELTPIPTALLQQSRKIMDLPSDAPILKKHNGVVVKQPLESKTSDALWSVWTSSAISSLGLRQIQQSIAQSCKRWTHFGVVPLMRNSPSYREAKLTEEGHLYDGLLVQMGV
jgi:hypothetical protein